MSRSHSQLLIVCMAGALKFSVGTKTSGAQNQDDKAITSNIQAKLFEDSVLKTRDIRVRTQGGVVTLSGTVNTELEKAAVVRIAGNQKGVRQVIDELAVSNLVSAPVAPAPTAAATPGVQAHREVTAEAQCRGPGDPRVLSGARGDGTVRIVSGSGTFARISRENKAVKVDPGGALRGTIALRVLNQGPAFAVVPLIETPSWGRHQDSWKLISNLRPGESTWNAQIDERAPVESGTYYIVFAFHLETNGASVASATEWAMGQPVWDDGNDLAQLDPSQILQARQFGCVVNHWLTEDGSRLVYVPADAITVMVSGPTAGPSLAAPGQGLTNEDIIKLVQVKLPDSRIIAKIKSSACAFDTSADGLDRLKQAGVSDAIVLAMLEGSVTPADLASETPVAPVPPSSTAATVQIPAGQPFTDTGLRLSAGDHVTVSASGLVTLTTDGHMPPMSPAGFPPNCTAASTVYGQTVVPFVAPQLPCWSLIGRIGTDGPIFEVGTQAFFRVQASGELFLGVNDNFFGDNSGSWTATITLSTNSGDYTPAAPLLGSQTTGDSTANQPAAQHPKTINYPNSNYSIDTKLCLSSSHLPPIDGLDNHRYVKFSFNKIHYVAVQGPAFMLQDDADAKLGKMIFYRINGNSSVTRLTEAQTNSIKNNHELAGAILDGLAHKYAGILPPPHGIRRIDSKCSR